MGMRSNGVLELLEERRPLKICAPMVRYSRLHFRRLVRKWGADVAFTPMITASTFSKSSKARDADFSTDDNDRPLIVQFGASSSTELIAAAEYISDVCDGIDINCGCPQKWAIKEKIGGYLLSHPELVHDMTLQLWQRIPNPSFTKSVKIRLDEDLKKTIDLCRQLEHAGVSFITVHGRTLKQNKEPPNWEAIGLIRDSVNIPIFANGNINTPDDITNVIEITNADGVMVANGLLTNPALFSSHNITPIQCINDWIDLNNEDQSCPVRIFHHHLIWMTEKLMPKAERIKFSDLTNKEDVINYLSDFLSLRP